MVSVEASHAYGDDAAFRNLTGLEREGYISRKKGTSDGRQTDVRLTPRGKRTADAVMADSQKALGALVDKLPRAERAAGADVEEGDVHADRVAHAVERDVAVDGSRGGRRHQGDELVGRVTSGGYGWRVGKSLALSMVRPDLAAVGTELEIAILGVRHKAVIIPDSPFDPDNTALRA